MRNKIALATLSLLLAGGLVAALIVYSGVDLADIKRATMAVPLWLFVAVLVLTALNQWISVLRWQVANRWFQPEAEPIPAITMFEATTWGALLGQFLPPQISMTSARWIATRKSSSVGVTLYEQLFDLVILGAGGLAALALLASSVSSPIALTLFTAIIAAGCLSIRLMFAFGHHCAARWAKSGLALSTIADRVAGPLVHASKAPAQVLAQLTALTIIRVALLGFRLIVIALLFAPGIDALLVAIGYPIVSLASAVPFLPGGLGLTEWAQTGLLVFAGAQSTALAALAAIMVRLIITAALAVLCVGLVPLSRVLQPRLENSEPETSAPA